MIGEDGGIQWGALLSYNYALSLLMSLCYVNICHKNFLFGGLLKVIIISLTQQGVRGSPTDSVVPVRLHLPRQQWLLPHPEESLELSRFSILMHLHHLDVVRVTTLHQECLENHTHGYKDHCCGLYRYITN